MVDPDLPALEVYQRRRGALRAAPVGEEHTSPRFGIRFVRKDGVLSVFHPDGRPFRTVTELLPVEAERDALAARLDEAEAERDAAAARAARLAARLAALGLDPDE